MYSPKQNVLLALLAISPRLSSARFTHKIANDDQIRIIEDDSTIVTADTIHDKLVTSRIIPEVLDDFYPSHQVDVIYTQRDQVEYGNLISVKDVSSRPVWTFKHIGPTADGDDDPVSPVNKTYTLALTDPDATSYADPKLSEMCHWLITNFTLSADGTPIMTTENSLSLSSIMAEPIGHHTDEDDEQDNKFSIFKHKKDKKNKHKKKKGKKDKKKKKKNKNRKLPGELYKYMAPSPPPKTSLHRYVFVLLEGNSTEAGQLQPPKERKHWGYGQIRHGVRDWAAENGLRVVGANFFLAQNKKQ